MTQHEVPRRDYGEWPPGLQREYADANEALVSRELFPLLDMAGIVRSGIPSDHLAAYRALTGQDFGSVAPRGPARYIQQLEIGYALHELTFGLFFLAIVAIPFRQGRRWAWLACWISLIATVGYSLTFAHYSSTTLAYSLVPAIGIPLLLLSQAPRFWRVTVPQPDSLDLGI
jgi:hypothetical protein